MEFILSFLPALAPMTIDMYVAAISALVVLLAAIADITKTKKDDEYVGYIKKGWDKIKSLLGRKTK